MGFFSKKSEPVLSDDVRAAIWLLKNHAKGWKNVGERGLAISHEETKILAELPGHIPHLYHDVEVYAAPNPQGKIGQGHEIELSDADKVALSAALMDWKKGRYRRKGGPLFGAVVRWAMANGHLKDENI